MDAVIYHKGKAIKHYHTYSSAYANYSKLPLPRIGESIVTQDQDNKYIKGKGYLLTKKWYKVLDIEFWLTQPYQIKLHCSLERTNESWFDPRSK